MKIILLSGGSGKRLWPMSNDARSKQFLRVLKDENENSQSMVQRVYGQLEKIGLGKDVTIATGANQVELIHTQLGETVNVVVEPERRDTYPAIMLACANLYLEKKVAKDETVVILPVDPFVDLDYFKRIIELDDILKNDKFDIALMGVKPTYPSEKYGYIIPKDFGGKQECVDKCYQVKAFKEKPNMLGAKNYIKEGALWNCGVFAFKLGYALEVLETNLNCKLEIDNISIKYATVLSRYPEMKKTSFDYEVVEKAKKIAVLEFQGMWKDLGTWNTLTEHISEPLTGKGIISESSTNTHVINELDIPVAVVGIKNAVIAVSPDGILVSDKVDSSHIKTYADKLVNRPMYEERRWGYYKVIDYMTKEDGNKVLTKYIKMTTGKNVSYQIHKKRKEIWTIVGGTGEFILNGEIQIVKSGDVLVIPKEAKHAIKSLNDLEFIEVQLGEELVEEDIERVAHIWEEIVSFKG